jgi:hypothetical protein
VVVEGEDRFEQRREVAEQGLVGGNPTVEVDVDQRAIMDERLNTAAGEVAAGFD